MIKWKWWTLFCFLVPVLPEKVQYFGLTHTSPAIPHRGMPLSRPLTRELEIFTTDLDSRHIGHKALFTHQLRVHLHLAGPHSLISLSCCSRVPRAMPWGKISSTAELSLSICLSSCCTHPLPLIVPAPFRLPYPVFSPLSFSHALTEVSRFPVYNQTYTLKQYEFESRPTLLCYGCPLSHDSLDIVSGINFSRF